MHERLQLIGEVDTRDQQLENLEAEVERLQGELAIERLRSKNMERANTVAIGELRRTLSPLFKSLQMVFGQIDAMGVGEEAAAPAKQDARWESWKQRMPGRPAEFIDLLLIHGSMTIKQFMAAAHCGQNSAYQACSKLGQAGVIGNSGGRYSLKP